MAATCALVTEPGYTGVSLRPLLDTVQAPLSLSCPPSTLQGSALDLRGQQHPKSCSILGGDAPDPGLLALSFWAIAQLSSLPLHLGNKESI